MFLLSPPGKMVALLALDNPVFITFLGHSTLVLLKTLALSPLISFYRVTKKIFVNPEDAAMYSSRLQLVSNNVTVERFRRIHLNDLESVIPFVLLGLLYVATGPSQWAATLHFRIYTISRFIHTAAYLFALPQPSRAIAFYIGYAVNISLAYNILTRAAF